jgi:hypothetical protein
LAFGALGVGLALHDRSVMWAALGLLADNCLGNFPKLTMARTLWCVYEREPTVVTRPGFGEVLAVVTDSENRKQFSGSLSVARRAWLTIRELVFFPGCLIALSATLTIDGIVALLGEQFTGLWSRSYLLGFVAVALASKVRRTVLAARQLRHLTE